MLSISEIADRVAAVFKQCPKLSRQERTKVLGNHCSWDRDTMSDVGKELARRRKVAMQAAKRRKQKGKQEDLPF